MVGSVLIKCLRTVGRVVYAGCMIHVVTNYVAEPTLCIGQSMEPTINNTSRNDIVLTEHLSTHLQSLKKNDIVIVRSPQDPSTSICKRIAGMEGDMVETNDCLDDDGEHKTIMVPAGHVWLTGDNVDNSVDSRSFGAVPCGLILGRVCYKDELKMPAFVEVMESPGYMDGIDVSDSSKIQGYDFLTFETHIFYWSQL